MKFPLKKVNHGLNHRKNQTNQYLFSRIDNSGGENSSRNDRHLGEGFWIVGKLIDNIKRIKVRDRPLRRGELPRDEYKEDDNEKYQHTGKGSSATCEAFKPGESDAF